MIYIAGFLIGFFASIPIGPVNLIAVSQVLRRGFLFGVLVGITTGLLDVLYCFVFTFGISKIHIHLTAWMPYLKIIAAAIIIFFSLRLLKHSKKDFQIRHNEKAPQFSSSDIHRPILAAFFLYVSNPTIYAFWLAVAGYMHGHEWIHAGQSLQIKFAFAAMVGIGATVWYLLLSYYVGKYHHQFTPVTMRRIFILLAILLLCFALYTLLGLL